MCLSLCLMWIGSSLLWIKIEFLIINIVGCFVRNCEVRGLLGFNVVI